TISEKLYVVSIAKDVHTYVTDRKWRLDPSKYEDHARTFFDNIPFGKPPLERLSIYSGYAMDRSQRSKAFEVVSKLGGIAQTTAFLVILEVANEVKKEIEA